MSAGIVYKYNFAIIKMATGGYIVHNKAKEFGKGHVHVYSFNAAISAVKLVKHKELPHNTSEHFIETLIRLSDDKEYIERLKGMNSC